MFDGNSDRNTVVRHELKKAITTRFIRIQPITWNKWISLRAEFYGCKAGRNSRVQRQVILTFRSTSKIIPPPGYKGEGAVGEGGGGVYGAPSVLRVSFY